MGKGFGVNSKAQEGRERKAAQAEIKKREQQKKKEEEEEKAWQVGSKTKTEKQVNDEKKRMEKFEKKKEKELLYSKEQEQLAQLKPVKPLPKEKGAKQPAKPSSSQQRSLSPVSTTSARSKSTIDGNKTPVYSASNIDDAIFLLSGGDSTQSEGLERHPERRVKAAYAAYEEREMPRLKEEYPGLRLTQLKERLYKMWLKAPENPFNQSFIKYNATKSQESLATASEIESSLDRLRFRVNEE